MGRTKVVHICDKFGVGGSSVHGCSRLFAWWMPRFDTDRFDVKLYGVKRPDGSSRAMEEMGVSLDYLGHKRLSPMVLRSFLTLIRRERPHVMHLHGWIAANFGRLAGWMTGTPTIMHEHGVDPAFPGSQRTADFALSAFTHTAVAVSRSVRDFLISRRFVGERKIRLIYNGAPLNEFSAADPADVEGLRREFGILNGAPVIGSIGRLCEQKGVTYLLKAARIVLDRHPDARFLIVGDGPDKDDLLREADKLRLGANVVFTGYRTDIPAVQSLLDIQVFPSLWEGTPLTVFEAMGMGKAIVSTTVDGLGEVLTSGQNALTAPPADPAALADAVVRLIEYPSLAHALASRAKATGKRFDVTQTVRNLESLYEQIRAGASR